MFPRSGGEKVYLEAVFKKPKYLATVIFAVNAIVLGFTASGCIVSPYSDRGIDSVLRDLVRCSQASMLSSFVFWSSLTSV